MSYNGKKNDYIMLELVDSNYSSFSKVWYKTISGGGEYSITNYAYEDRKKCDVRLSFYAPYRYFYSWSANGLWSPDSSKTYS